MKALTGLFSKPRPVVIGHSHSEPVAAAAKAAGVAVDMLNFWHLKDPVSLVDGRPRLGAELRTRLSPPGPSVVFSLIGGAVHQDIGLVVHPRPFDLILPDRPDLPIEPGAELIPVAAVRAAMHKRTQYYLDIMTAVRETARGPIFHLQSPPTYANEVLPENDPGFAYFFGKDARFSPPWLRFKLWRLHSAIVAAHCAMIGMEFVPHPAEAVDRQGFLRMEYSGTPAHANAAYGALLLTQIQARCKRGARTRRSFPAGPDGLSELHPRVGSTGAV